MYDNQNEIDEIEKQMRQILPELRSSSYGLDGNVVTSVGIAFPIKGNSSKIKKLEKLGWRKLCRKKVRTDNNGYSRRQYDGYIMHQCMQLDI